MNTEDPFRKATHRREPLVLTTNPRSGLDYICEISQMLEARALESTLSVRVLYIPDRDLISPNVLGVYFERIADLDWQSLEDLAQAVVGDLNSEVMPRWIQISTEMKSELFTHRVTLEERQPRWDNRHLLPRLAIG